MGRKIFAQHYAVSHVPYANEKPYVVSVSMRHNAKQLLETMPTVKTMSPDRRDRLRQKNVESNEAKERVGRPSQKNISAPFRGELAPIKGKKHIEDPTGNHMRSRPIQYVEGGASTAGGYMMRPPP